MTHNDDQPVPGPYLNYLENTKIAYWFGQNIDREHPKLKVLPIGLANAYWPYGNVDAVNTVLSELPLPNRGLAYLNCTISSNPDQRSQANIYFADKPFCTKVGRKPYIDYLRDMASFTFIVSPEGAGVDCYRTWEAMLMGSIPLVKHSAIDAVFEGLPVVLVNSWNEVTEAFLHENARILHEQIRPRTPLC